MTVLEYRFRVRRRSAANWTSLNEVLLDSEIGRETDNDETDLPAKVKIGDGVTAWNDLPYFTGDLTGVLLASAIDTDVTLAANSDAKIPSQKAVKTYVDAAVTGLLDLRGATNCSANPNYPAALKGDAYVVSAAGKIGGASGVSVDIGDVFVASADNAGGTQASVGASWFVLEHNLAGALLTSDLGVTVQAYINLTVGRGAGNIATNSVLGFGALASNVSGHSNTAIGYNALALCTVSNNTAVGNGALDATTTGTFNAALGSNALGSNTTGSDNGAIGYSALGLNTTGSQNEAMGTSALGSNTTGSFNTAVGYGALNVNSTADNNTAIGAYALDANTTGVSNVGIGKNAAGATTTGNNNTAIGTSTLFSNITGSNNVALGINALLANTGSNNTGVGAFALDANTSGAGSVGIGVNALSINTTGDNNVAIGNAAGDANTTGSNNIAIGYNTDCDSATASDQINIGNVYRHNRLKHTPATLATLNAFVGLAAGTRAICSDSTTIVFNATVSGGGANTVPVWYTGSAWLVG